MQPGALPPPPEPPRFTASTTFSIKAKPVSGLSKTVSRLAASGLLQMRSIRFYIEQERSALNEARRSAMKDAREQAEVYASAGNFRLVEITEIADGEASPDETGAADLPLPRFVQIIPPATVSFRASVNVTWRIAPR